MSIICTEIDNSICKHVTGSSGHVWATIDPATKHQLNLPANLKLHSVFLPRKYIDWAERLHNFKVRESDVWVAGFPKSGTILIHNIVRQLINGLNFNLPSRKSDDEFFDAPIVFRSASDAELIDSFERLNEKSSPRTFKTHLPPFLLPKNFWTIKPKIIYIARNPKDSIVSWYYMMRNVAHYEGTLSELCELFMNDHTVFAPFVELILSYWQLRHLDNVLFLTYEELSANLFDGVKQINAFLGFAYGDEQLKQLADHVSFETMRKHILNNETFRGEKRDTSYW